MAFDQRSYASAVREPSRFDGAPVTKALLWINIGVFVLDWFFLKPEGARLPLIYQNFGFILNADMSIGAPWRFITYQFIHAGFFHLFANMLGVFIFGPMVERWWGSKRFIAFYLICGTLGAYLFTVLSLFGALPNGANGSLLVGASGSLFGILIAAARIAPDARVMLIFPPIPMKLRTLVYVVLGFATFTILIRGNNAGGEAAHLGGALAGFILMRYPQFLSAFKINFKKNSEPASGSPPRSQKTTYRPPTPPKLRPRGARPASDPTIDAILEKVHEHGLQSLTDEEKQILREASKRSS